MTVRAQTDCVPVSVVVPVRDAADMLEECLRSVVANRPAEVLVVDGGSVDGSREIAERVARDVAAAGGPQPRTSVRVLDNPGQGVAAARRAGVEAATCDVVGLVDADIVLPGEGALRGWLAELGEGGWAGLQAGLQPEALDRGYWSTALARHQQVGRSRFWFTLCATLLPREVLLTHPLDERFTSGEDVEYRRRLKAYGYRVSVSRTTLVRHRFRGGYAEARHQWEDDGAGLARTIRKNGLPDAWLALVPLLSFARGVALTLPRWPSMTRYWAGYLWYNHLAMLRTLLDRRGFFDVAPAPPDADRGERELGLSANSSALAATRIVPMVIGFGSWTVAARIFDAGNVGLAAAAVSASALVSQVAVAGQGQALVLLLPRRPDRARLLARAGGFMAAGIGLVTALVLSLAASAFAPQLSRLAGFDARGVLFLVLSVATSLAYYYDHVAVARRRSDRALGRSIVQAVCLLGAVALGGALAADGSGVLVLLSGATLGVVASTVMGIVQERALPGSTSAASTLGADLRDLTVLGLPNLTLTLAHRTAMFSLPFVVTELVSPASNAAWYVAWMMAMAIWFIPNSVAYSLQARLAGRPPGGDPRVEHYLRTHEISSAVRSSLFLGGVVSLGAAMAGPILLEIMGDVYETATPALWVLCLTVVPATYTELWLAVSRVRERVRWAALATGLTGTAALTSAVLLSEHGLTAIAASWLGAQSCLGCVSAWALRHGEEASRYWQPGPVVR